MLPNINPQFFIIDNFIKTLTNLNLTFRKFEIIRFSKTKIRPKFWGGFEYLKLKY